MTGCMSSKDPGQQAYETWYRREDTSWLHLPPLAKAAWARVEAIDNQVDETHAYPHFEPDGFKSNVKVCVCECELCLTEDEVCICPACCGS